MSCGECEVALGLEERSAEVEAHLRDCAACRALAAELRADAEAFESMAAEQFAPLRVPVQPAVWPAIVALAAAAMLIVIFGSLELSEQTMPAVHYALAPMKFDLPPVVPKPRPKRASARRTLMVKMLTADPNVVIYWQVDEEGIEK